MTANKLLQLINFSFNAHAQQSREPKNAVRLWDKKTPYGIHPTWCAMTILSETKLPEDIRLTGAEALLLHDILEDTTTQLPYDCPPTVVALVKEKTFQNSDEEMKLIWSRSAEAQLLTLYDKVSNLLDGAWMSPEKRSRYTAYTLQLADKVESDFGTLNIVTIARAICV